MHNFNELIDFFKCYYHIEANINIYYNDKICDDRTHKNRKILGFTDQLSNNTYNIYFRSKTPYNAELVFHELFHVKQLYYKDLQIIDNKIYWKGELIDDMPYLERPWEKEAIENAKAFYIIYKRRR